MWRPIYCTIMLRVFSPLRFDVSHQCLSAITGVVMFIVPFLAATGLLAAPLVPFVRPAAKRLSSICMRGEGLSEYEKYQRARGADSFKDAEDQYKTVRAVITPFKWLLLACLK